MTDERLPGLDIEPTDEIVPEWLRPRVVRCSSCGADMIRATHRLTRRRSVIDAAPDPKGNLLLAIEDVDGAPSVVYSVASKAERAELAGRLHLSHFVTCPDAKKHRTTSPKGNKQ